MKRTTSRSFKLIPSVQSRSETLAPISLTPALPVRFSEGDDRTVYARVDTGAQISLLDESLGQSIGNIRRYLTREIQVQKMGRITRADIVKANLIICDEEFLSWIRLTDVPFAILPLKQRESGSDIILGFDSCLANLRMIIDYPKKTLRVTAPMRLSILDESVDYVLPSRVQEGERLIKLGSYDAAIALIYAGLEEVLGAVVGVEHFAPSSRISDMLLQKGVSDNILVNFDFLRKLRNKAVHGSTEGRVTAKEAKQFLHKSKAIIRTLLKKT